MKKIKIHFERAPGLRHIDVLIRAAERDAEVDALMERFSARAADGVLVTGEDGTQRKLKESEIVCVAVNGKQISVTTEDARYLTRQSLQSLEDTLDTRRFVRVSRYELVNLDKVLKYDFTLSGTLRLELAGGMETWASRRCIPAIRRLLTGKEAQGT